MSFEDIDEYVLIFLKNNYDKNILKKWKSKINKKAFMKVVETSLEIEHNDENQIISYPLTSDEKVIDWIKGEGIWKNKGLQPKLKNHEKEWGCELVGENTKMWSAEFGERIVHELLEKKGNKVWKPKEIQGLRPDRETEEYVYEIKTRNWTTNGTAGEKIMGVPWKYADIPKLYGKKLRIVVVGYQEYEAVNNFKVFDTTSKTQQKMIKFWKELGIEFIKCSDLL
jgi:hypothetical protein